MQAAMLPKQMDLKLGAGGETKAGQAEPFPVSVYIIAEGGVPSVFWL